MKRLLDYVSALREYGRDYLLENTGLKVLALLITAVLWLSVQSRPVSEATLASVPIEFHNLPKSPDLTVSKYDTLSARVTLVGPRDELDGLQSSELAVVADMSGVERGVRVIPLELDKTRLPINVKARNVEPRSIRVTVEPVVAKEVSVAPRFDGSLPAGYEILTKQISPPTVRIVGAESAVREITQVSTETVSLSDKSGFFTESVAIDIGSPNVNISDDSARKVQLSVNIGEIRKRRVIDHVPVAVEGGPASATPQFVKVTVYGAPSAVDRMTADDLTASVQFPGPSGQGRLVAPNVAVSSTYSGMVVVQLVEPSVVRLR